MFWSSYVHGKGDQLCFRCPQHIPYYPNCTAPPPPTPPFKATVSRYGQTAEYWAQLQTLTSVTATIHLVSDYCLFVERPALCAWEESLAVSKTSGTNLPSWKCIFTSRKSGLLIKTHVYAMLPQAMMNMTAENHSVPLSDGNSIPLIGLGTYGDPRTVRPNIGSIWSFYINLSGYDQIWALYAHRFQWCYSHTIYLVYFYLFIYSFCW